MPTSVNPSPSVNSGTIIVLSLGSDSCSSYKYHVSACCFKSEFFYIFHIICFIEIWFYAATELINRCDKMLMWSNLAEIKCHCNYLSEWSNVCDKLLHKNMSWPHFSKPQVRFILLPECCTSAKETVPKVFEKYFSCVQQPRSCQKKLKSFCYICVEVVLKLQRKPFSKQMRKYYELYFGSKVRDKDKFWALRICCSSSSRSLAGNGWKKVKGLPVEANISQSNWGQIARWNFHWPTD